MTGSPWGCHPGERPCTRRRKTGCGSARRWAIENGAALKQRHPDYAGFWLREWLAEGTLAAAAWSGFLRLPKFGVYHILERVGA